MLNICCITATAGRVTCLKRAIKYFINQNYEGPHTMLIFNNSEVEQKLNTQDLPDNKKIILVNRHISRETNKPYKNLGEIYRDAMLYIPEQCEIITHSDDDDTFLPNHISEGVKGIKKAFKQGKTAYKPKYSYLRGVDFKTALVENTLEPSIFLTKQHLFTYGYGDYSTEQHLTWYDPLHKENKLFIDPDGKPTLIYDWSGTQGVFKTSGDYQNPQNFSNYRTHSKDHGDGLLTSASDEEVSKYYILSDAYGS